MEFAPTYYIKGDDPSLISEALTSLIEEIVGKEDPALCVEELSDESVTANQIVDACQTPAFLTSRRIVIARQIGRFKTDEIAPLAAYIAEPLDSTVLICVAGGGQVSRSLTDAIRKHGHITDTAVPTGKARNTWFAEQLRELPVNFSPDARALLIEHLGEDVSRLFGIADVLAASYGAGATIDTDQIAPFLGEEGAVAPWELTDCIDRGDIDGALRQQRRMMRAGERHALVIMATLQRHFRAMLALDGRDISSEHQAAQLLGISPYPAKKAWKQSENLGHTNIARAISLLAQADLDLRGASGVPGEVVMEVLVARLCRLTTAKQKRPPLRRPTAVSR